MTVEEAKKNWCPILNKAQTCPCFCAADRCMAWRWNYEDVVIGETISGTKILASGKGRISETDGYCGLIGKEGAE